MDVDLAEMQQRFQDALRTLATLEAFEPLLEGLPPAALEEIADHLPVALDQLTAFADY